MTNKEFAKNVAGIAKKTMKAKQFRYTDINIDYGLPYISIGIDGCEFYAQGEEAGDIIAEVIEASNKTNLAVSTCLIWWLESAGVFQK